MKNYTLIILLITISLTAFSQQNAKSIYSFKSITLDGDTFDFAQLKGKKILIVNTASKCGYTPQYEQLQKLYAMYGPDKFVIIGFPANNFLRQEPGVDGEIREFCTKNYGVTFPMMSKISVKGKDIDPIYDWLTHQSENGVMDAEIEWNFQKFMIDENGKLVGKVLPKESPMCDKIINWIKTTNDKK